MQFERLSERLLANAVRAKPAERLFAEIRQHQYKVCTALELPAPEVKNYIFENLLAEHTEQITAVIVTVLRYVGDEAVIQIMEERFFVYEKGGVAY